MIPTARTASMLLLMVLSGCADVQHPLDQQLSNLTPPALVKLEGLAWPAGSMLCPLSTYESALPGDSSIAKRVNSFLKEKQFLGDEGSWSLVVIKPAPAGDAGIEHIVFKRRKYDIVRSSADLIAATGSVPTNFEAKECVELQEARILVARNAKSNRTIISFGTEK